MKKLRSNIIALIVVSALVLFLVLKDDFNEIIDVLLNSNKIYIFIGILIVLLGDLFKSLSVSSIIRKSKKEYKFKDGFLLTLKTNFFNGVTPFSLGGQPFQLYSLKKKDDINYVTGVNILFKDFYTYQMALVILSTICLIINYLLNIVIFSNIIRELIWIGYIINLLIAMFLIYLPHSKSHAKKIVNFAVTLLNRIRIIKDKEKAIDNMNDSIANLKIQIKDVGKNKKMIFNCIILNMLKIIMTGVTTYLCFKAVGSHTPILESIVLTIIIITMASFVPIPGASGGMEYGFVTLFASYVVDIKLSAVMLIWRSLTYYMLVVCGGILVVSENRE